MARGYGSGGRITQTPSGAFRAQPRIEGQRHSVTGRTKKEVLRKIRELQELYERQGATLAPATTVEAYLTAWLRTTQASRRETTRRIYEQAVRLRIIPALGRLKLADLRPEHVDAMIADLAQAGNVSPRTLQITRETLRNALNRAMNRGLVVRNAAAMSDPIKSRPKELEVWSEAEARAIVTAARKGRERRSPDDPPGDPLEALFVIALTLGPRVGELLGLRWQDVDLERRTITIGRGAAIDTVDGKRRMVLTATKTKGSRRTLTLPALAVEALRRRQDWIAHERMLASAKYQELGLVFGTTVGTLQTHTNFYSRYWYPLLERAGLPRRGFHSTRHTAATLMLASGSDLHTVQKTLGHSQIALTANLYGHLSPKLQQAAADKLGEMLTTTEEDER